MNVWMVDPATFDVVYAINPHMAAHLGSVDRPRARRQWDELVRIYRSLGVTVDVAPAVVGLPDLVFAANACAAIAPGLAVLSHMATAERRPEVAHVAAWLRGRGWQTLPAPSEPFEGYGDLRPIPDDARFLGGHGFRTTPGALAQLPVEVIPLRLVDPRLYHLDTALMPIRPGVAAWVPAAFDAPSRAVIERLFPRRVEIPLDEAVDALAANGIVVRERVVVLEAAARRTCRMLEEAGLQVIGVDTSEFRKSGGSVFCLTQAVPEAGRSGSDRTLERTPRSSDPRGFS